ncbi:hypothetical protein AJ80_05751, partial [Polytolypa hystricis UAMH7299]
ADRFSRSAASDDTGARLHNASTCTSSLSLRDNVIRYIEIRALEFQSLSLPLTHLKPSDFSMYVAVSKDII